MMNKIRPAFLLLTLVVAGCSSVLTSDQAAKQYYTLMPLAAGAGGPDGAEQELALTVTAVPGLDTDRIQSLGTDARLNYFANARWPDHLPELLASVIKRSLAANGRFAFVEVADHASPNGWLLELEVQQFYGLQTASGETTSVVVGFEGSLTCDNGRHPVALSASGAVATERLSAVVSAHQGGLDDATRQLLAQIGGACP